MSGRVVAVRDQSKFGTKRICVSCTARFYDFNKASFTCPKCGTEQTATTPSKLTIDELIIKDEEESRRKLATRSIDSDDGEEEADDDIEMEELDIDAGGDEDLGDDEEVESGGDEEYEEDERD